jgi:hypothetical protein
MREVTVADLQKSVDTQLANIQAKTGKTMDELAKVLRESGLTKHSELRSYAQQNLGLGYGDANTLVHMVFQSDGTSAAEARGATADDVLSEIYSGPKVSLRPIHDALMLRITPLGEFEVLPKKGYVSLRRKKQFAMIGPGTNTRVDLGLNVKGLEDDPRLRAEPQGSMCNYKIRLTDPAEVDDQVAGWLRQAFDSAG